jgi:tRNA A-37 threonylcarbamoyl transferase component Bud32
MTNANGPDPNFTLDNFANSGLYGEVWQSTQRIPERKVAIKIVNPDYGMHFNAAEHAKGLVKAGDHPNIVTVFQVTKTEHPTTGNVVDAVVMEWLDGATLGDRLGQSSLFPASDARKICDGVLNGIAHLHSNGVAHSDLHPGNVVLTAHGPKIIDINYSSAQSLARLTTMSRKLQIEADIAQAASIVGRVVAKSAIDLQFYHANENELRHATKLDEVREFMMRVFSQSKKREDSEARDTEESLVFRIESAIENQQKITLRRLVMTKANEIASVLASERFTAQGQVNREILRARFEACRTTTNQLLSPLAQLTFWRKRFPEALAVEAIDRIANAREKSGPESGMRSLLALGKFPALALVYAGGVSAVAQQNYRGMFSLLRETKYYEHGTRKRRLWEELAFWAGENHELMNKEVLGRDLLFPVSQVLEEDTRVALLGLVPSERRFLDAFDRFEFFASLECFILSGAPMGASFLWRRMGFRSDEQFFDRIREEAVAQGENWAPVKDGLMHGVKQSNQFELLDQFGSSIEQFRTSLHMR